MRIVASTASMLEEPTREDEEPFWIQSRAFKSQGFLKAQWGSSIHKWSLSEAASASMRLPQTHWGCLSLTETSSDSLRLLFQCWHALADWNVLPHLCQFPAIFEEPIKFLKYAWGTLLLNSHVCVPFSSILGGYIQISTILGGVWENFNNFRGGMHQFHQF